MTLHRRSPSGPWWYDFTVAGQRYRGSTETADRADGEIIEAKRRSDALLGTLVERRPEITLTEAMTRYRAEVSAGQSSEADTERQAGLLVRRLGGGVSLSALSGRAIARYVGGRRAEGVSNATVNRETQLLRRVMRRAETVWGAAVSDIDWRGLMLPEAEERNVALSPADEDRLFAALRVDYHPLFRFALATGVRLENCLTLTWPRVDWSAGVIRFQGKSRRPGGKQILVPIVPHVAAILSAERGRHPERVFTWSDGSARHPFTSDGWRRQFDRTRRAAGLPSLRFHDLRHAAANRALVAAGGNLKTVQKMLGHSSITSTMRYLRSDISDVRAAMERMAPSASVRLPARTA